MFINNKDLDFLIALNSYLEQLDDEMIVGKSFQKNLSFLIEKLEIKRIAKNSINSRLIAERRKHDKNYARSKKGDVQDV